MRKRLVWLGAFVLSVALAQAEVRIGVTLSATGPAASLGIPEKNTLLLIEAGKLDRMPKGVKVRFFILDDGTDPTAAVKNTKKLIQENRVHLIIGGTTSPNSLAMIDAVAEAGVPFISLAAAKAIVSPVDLRQSPTWASTPPTARAGRASSRRRPRPPASGWWPASVTPRRTPRSPVRC